MNNFDDLYTARYALLTDSPVPDGPALESLLDVLRPILGPEPDWFDGAVIEEPLIGVPERDDQKAPDQLDPIVDVEWTIGPDQFFPMVGQGFTVEEFARYLAGLDDNHMTWNPRGVTVHHTFSPNLSDRPHGWSEQLLLNLRYYYKNTRKWSRGPHLFTDENKVWVFSPLTSRGIHASSFNSTHFGLEMLGDYDFRDDPESGRGAKVIETSAAAVALINDRFGFSAASMNTHRDDPKTSKTCMGRKIEKEWFRSKVAALMD